MVAVESSPDQGSVSAERAEQTTGPSRAGGLEITGLWKAFGTQPVLCGIDLEVPVGSLTAILGPSGSGKTTLLRVVAGFEQADRGRIALDGRVVEDGDSWMPPERRGIGYVPQEGALFPHLTVAANVAFGVSRGMRKRPGTSSDELLEMVGLSGMGRRYPHQLSGGQQQRVALARALAIRPSVVLLDEPFSSLDAGLRASVRADVHGVLKAGGVTAVLVTHDQDEALSMADHVAVIRDGRIGQLGTPQDLYDHPVDPAMAQFLGDANLVAAVVDGGRVTTPFGTLDLRRNQVGLSPSGPVVALVRPEQLALSTTVAGKGLRGRVLRTEFHGHDAVFTVDTGTALGAIPIVIRAEGELALAVGTEVEITAVGTALAWPAAAPDS